MIVVATPKRRRYKRVFRMGFCTDGFVEIYEIRPRPWDMGEFFLAFRKKWARKVVQLFCGITAGGAKHMADCFRKRDFDPTELLLSIERKSGQAANLTPLV